MVSDPEDFEDFVQSLRGVFFALRRLTDDLLADLACTAVERSVLHELDRDGPRSVPDLAFSRAVSRQTMQKTVDRLRERKWLFARDNPRHQRSPLLALTASGRQVFREIGDRERRLLTQSNLPLTGPDLRRTTTALRRLGAFFNDHPPPPGSSRNTEGE